MKNIGIIDIGSNSMRLVIVRINEGYFKVIDEVKESVRLGKGMTENSLLEPMRVNKAIDTLKFFKNLCGSMAVEEVIAAATAAVRKASNGQEFIKRIKSETGICVRVLTGEEESYYDYFGVINSMDVRNSLIMDIGGGSAEFIWVKDRKMVKSYSLPFGAITVTERFGLSNALDRQSEEILKDFLFSEFSKITWLAGMKGYPMIGIGGTIRNIGKIDRKRKAYPLDIAHNYPMTAGEVAGVYEMVKGIDVKQRAKIKGLSKDRTDIFLGALSVVEALIEYCGIPQIYVSGNGLREGLIYEYILKSSSPVEDVLDLSLNGLLSEYGMDKKHAGKVLSMVEQLFRELQTVHNIKVDCSKIIKAASLLHDIGTNISYYDHQRHSYYMILNSRINGLSHREITMASYGAVLHRKDEFKADDAGYKKLLSAEDIQVVQVLGVLIKISESLNRGMGENIERVQCSIQDDTVIIKIFSKSSPWYEIKEAMEGAGTFKKVFNKRLIIV